MRSCDQTQASAHLCLVRMCAFFVLLLLESKNSQTIEIKTPYTRLYVKKRLRSGKWAYIFVLILIQFECAITKMPRNNFCIDLNILEKWHQMTSKNIYDNRENPILVHWNYVIRGMFCNKKFEDAFNILYSVIILRFRFGASKRFRIRDKN